MKVERKDLKVGTTYYISGWKETKGVFVGRSNNSIYFDCGKDHTYYYSIMPGREHLVSFNTEGEGFEKVKIINQSVASLRIK
jgi:hypothetical protein